MTLSSGMDFSAVFSNVKFWRDWRILEEVRPGRFRPRDERIEVRDALFAN